MALDNGPPDGVQEALREYNPTHTVVQEYEVLVWGSRDERKDVFVG